MSKIDAAKIIPFMLTATKNNTEFEGEVYGVPHVWVTSGLIVNRQADGAVKHYTDLCGDSLLAQDIPQLIAIKSFSGRAQN